MAAIRDAGNMPGTGVRPGVYHRIPGRQKLASSFLAKKPTERATKVACISSTESSTEDPKPSLRISTPKSFAEAAAPYSLAAATVMSKGRAWSEYQGRAGSLKPWTSESGMLSSSSTVALTGTAISRVRVELKTPWHRW